MRDSEEFNQRRLKVKMRSLLTVVALLSIVLFSAGTAHAILGVDDAVPGQDLAWPIFCVKTPSGSNSLNTNWAIADLIGGTPDGNGDVVAANCAIYDYKSALVVDFGYVWTPFDVVVDNCASLVSTLTVPQQVALEKTYNSVVYHAGYIKCTQVDTAIHTGATAVRDRFMNNLYLVDTALGFASGFNPPSLELGLTPYLGENTASAQEVTAGNVFLRYFVGNTNANTWNWWILLAGRNQYNTINISSTRRLQCDHVCDEDEHCLSAPINIPDELNVINVADILPGPPLNTTYPRAGFAACSISEAGTRNIIGVPGSFTITGTFNNPTLYGSTYYSLYGYSYQRINAGSIVANYDVVHPMFRHYCSGSTVATSTAGAFAADNQIVCGCSGTGC
jgi:hypothetical protein